MHLWLNQYVYLLNVKVDTYTYVQLGNRNLNEQIEIHHYLCLKLCLSLILNLTMSMLELIPIL